MLDQDEERLAAPSKPPDQVGMHVAARTHTHPDMLQSPTWHVHRSHARVVAGDCLRSCCLRSFPFDEPANSISVAQIRPMQCVTCVEVEEPPMPTARCHELALLGPCTASPLSSSAAKCAADAGIARVSEQLRLFKSPSAAL